MDGICYIVGAMPLDEGYVPAPRPGDLVIAADGGYAALEALGIVPDLVIGDFDSLGRVPDHPNLHVLPCEKDYTDTHSALNLGREQGYRRFLILGGLGGRLDHSFANLQLLHEIAQRGEMGLLYGGGQAAAVLVSRDFHFPAELSGCCSVFSLSGQSCGVTLRHLKYELDNSQLTSTFPLGVSNEFTGRPARVSVEEGALLLIWDCPPSDRLLREIFAANDNRSHNSPCSLPQTVLY